MEYESVQDVLDEVPDFSKLKTLGKIRTAITASDATLDLLITAPDTQQYDCVSRYFAPTIGIDEDPVTGSIHTAVAPLWAERLGKQELVAYQASTRGGTLYCRILDDRALKFLDTQCCTCKVTLHSTMLSTLKRFTLQVFACI